MAKGWKWTYSILALCILLASGCEGQTGFGPAGTAQECVVDADCMRAGCSGTVCQAKGAEPMITTCEWREEYACFRDIGCGCVRGQCAWQTTPAFDACLEEKRAAHDEGR